MRRALERYGAGEAVIVPVLVRTTPDWNQLPGLGSLQALPTRPGATEVIPVKNWEDQDEACTSVIEGLRPIIEKLRRTPPESDAAESSLAHALAVLRQFLERPDPGNAVWQRDLSLSYSNVGDVQRAQGDLPGALKILPRQPWNP
jgi:hypothetical protein